MDNRVVSQEDIFAIVSWIDHMRLDPESTFVWRAAHFYAVSIQGSGWEDRLADALLRANYQAAKLPLPKRSPYVPHPISLPITAFCLMERWINTSGYGEVPPVFLFIRELYHHIAVEMIHESALYAMAKKEQ